jgi:hypothetical protein
VKTANDHISARAVWVAVLIGDLTKRERTDYVLFREKTIEVFGYETFNALQNAAFRCIGDASRRAIKRIIDTLDDYMYWSLSDERYRRDGFVMEPGSDDPNIADEIRRVEGLMDMLMDVAGYPADAEPEELHP